MTTTYSWDYNNRLSSVTSPTLSASFLYDADGTRVKSVLGSITTKTPTTWYNISGTVPTKHILLPDGEMLAVVEGSNASATVSYIHTDHLTGSAIITSSAGSQTQLLDYYPFGTIRLNNQSSSFNEKRKFAGHEYDTETSLSYMQVRYYHPGTGRFVSQDPAFLAVGDRGAFENRFNRSLEQHLQNPQALNSYAYGLNNPVTFRDPQGEVVPIILAVWAGVELGLSAYDAYSTYQTLQSSDVSTAEKAVTAGGFAAGLLLPGGGYGTAGKQAVKHGDDVIDAIKTSSKILGPSAKYIDSLSNLVHRALKQLHSRGNSVLKPTQDYLDPKAVQEYYNILKEGGKVDPVEVLDNSGIQYILEGHHRYIAGKIAGVDVPTVNMGSGHLRGTDWNKVKLNE